MTGWRFDGFIVIVSTTTELVARYALPKDSRAQSDADHLGNVALLVRVLRVFRALRVLRIFGHQKRLRRVFLTIVRFVPIVPRFLCVFVVLFYVYMPVAVPRNT